ncbi:ABC transporter permease [Venatoribacter cucullus]|uniref:ABC transporter permease n=1 Tax=Venatoribacter cucullus TaxID=2661630 RepID=UPI0022407BB3|nr:ABC transporter permease [Venatoribacter cucullus]UZK03872.1 FtsX-like permease family protein [Venatoribacter cucullus]
MRVQDWLVLVLSSVRFNPLKSLLTALGIAIGIAAVTLLTALGEGVRGYVVDNFSQFGTRIISVTPGRSDTAGMGTILSSVQLLTMADRNSLARLPHAEYVIPSLQGSGSIRYGERSRSTEIHGTSADFTRAWSFPLAQGRFLPDSGGGPSPAFVVLGHTVWQELFQGRPALGQFIRVSGQRFRVVGVMQPKGSMLGFDLDDMVYIPADRALSLFNREGLMEINLVFGPGTNATDMAQRIRTHLTERHGQEDFTIITQDEMLSSLDNILSVLTLGVAALGGISLLVGGVGIFTVMTTNIRERTAEIGLLRAIGSSRRQLLSLFLGEAVILSLLGAITGMLAALAILFGLALLLPGLPLQPSPFYLLLSLLISAVIGLLAGLGPAWQASLLSPIEALRNE